jgi:hypothetical protein
MEESDLDRLYEDYAKRCELLGLSRDHEKPYKLSFGRVFYFALCAFVVVVIGILVPIWTGFKVSILAGMVLAICVWLITYGTAFRNGRQVLAEHVVYRWCAKRNITKTQWRWQRSQLTALMPSYVRWFTPYVDEHSYKAWPREQ